MLIVTKLHGVALISDQGFGARHIGVPTCGAMDKLTLRLLNGLLGNAPEAAAVEVMGSVSFYVDQPGVAILGPTGAQAKLNGSIVHSGQVMSLSVGDVLQVLPSQCGLWSLLALGSGVDGKCLFGSRSKSLALGGGISSAGSPYGPLRLGERIGVTAGLEPEASFQGRASLPGMGWFAQALPEIFFVKGPEWPVEQNPSELGFIACMNPLSNRMGYRLDFVGNRPTVKEYDLRSYPTQPGLIQCPPDGRPIVLMADCQTTGGYPRLGFVPEAELWKIALLKPGQNVRFEAISLSMACKLNNKMKLLEQRYCNCTGFDKQ